MEASARGRVQAAQAPRPPGRTRGNRYEKKLLLENFTKNLLSYPPCSKSFSLPYFAVIFLWIPPRPRSSPGAQLAVLVLLVILITIFGVLYEDRGSILTAFIVCYALTSFVGGYVSGSLYKQVLDSSKDLVSHKDLLTFTPPGH